MGKKWGLKRPDLGHTFTYWNGWFSFCQVKLTKRDLSTNCSPSFIFIIIIIIVISLHIITMLVRIPVFSNFSLQPAASIIRSYQQNLSCFIWTSSPIILNYSLFTESYHIISQSPQWPTTKRHAPSFPLHHLCLARHVVTDTWCTTGPRQQAAQQGAAQTGDLAGSF